MKFRTLKYFLQDSKIHQCDIQYVIITDICAGGCEAVMRYLCNQASVDYMSPCRSESPKNIVDNAQTADSIDSTLRRTYLDDGYGGAPRRIFDYENLKVIKKN